MAPDDYEQEYGTPDNMIHSPSHQKLGVNTHSHINENSFALSWFLFEIKYNAIVCICARACEVEVFA